MLRPLLVSAVALIAAPALAQPQQGASGTTSGPAAGTPATMNTGRSQGMTASPHQKQVLKNNARTPTQPDTSGGQPHRG